MLDNGTESSNEKLKDKIRNTNVILIEITMFSYCYQSGYDLTNFIKNNTNIPLVVGGAYVSSTKKQILEETISDFAVKHEGEKTLLELSQYISVHRNDYENIDGLIWRNNNEIIENKDRKFLTSEELCELPFLDHEAFELNKYTYYETKTLLTITSL